MNRLLPWLPVIVVGAGLVASGTTAQVQIGNNDKAISANAAAIGTNAEDVEEIQKLLIQRQGHLELELFKIQTEQSDQADDLTQILQILQDIQARQ